MILTTPEHDMKVFIDSCKRNNVAKARMALSLGVDKWTSTASPRTASGPA